MGSPQPISIHATELRLTDVQTRLPFRFGGAILNAAPLATLRVLIKTADGEDAEGFSSDLLVPKWFEKDPSKSARDDVISLLASIERATAAWTRATTVPVPVFAAWRAAYAECMGAFDPTDTIALVRGFGVGLLERAVMDATCRAADTSFHGALRADLFGFTPGEVHPDLASWDLAASLPGKATDSIEVRHTIGMDDPLRIEDVKPMDRADDGFPQALDEDIARYGVRRFKVKVGAGEEEDARRLTELAAFFESALDGQPVITLDGNERYADLASFLSMLEATARDPLGARLVERIAFIEQPLDRVATFDLDATAAMSDLSVLAPLVIDEADGHVDAFTRAVALGYRGVSIKNCKGVFRALLNRGLVEARGGELFQTGEDLTNLPAVALQEDLALMCALGVEDVERNGHHYFRGLDHLPEAEQTSALDRHADLYARELDCGCVSISEGKMMTGSLACVGYGHEHDVAFEDRTPMEEWAPQEA
jgi:hypothetical protein